MCHCKFHTVLICCCLAFVTGSFAQDQKIADSLAVIYRQNNLSDPAKIMLLGDLSFHETRDLNKGLDYAEEMIRLAEKTGDKNSVRRGYFLKGTKLRSLSKLDESLAAYFSSAEIAREIGHLKGEAEAYSAIADAYAIAGDQASAKVYYNRGIATLRQKPKSQEDTINLASILLNTGDAYLRFKNFDSALYYTTEAKRLFVLVNYPTGIAYSLGNMGTIYASIGQNSLAEKNINDAIRILEKNQDYYPICVYLVSMADVYANKDNNATALNYTLRSLHLAQQYGLKEQIRDASQKLSGLYEQTGDHRDALQYYKMFVRYRDSLVNLETERNMNNQRYNFEMAKNQTEKDALNREKRSQRKLTIALAIILGLTIIIVAILFRNNKNKQKAFKVLHLQKKETDRQKAKAEDTLAELQATQMQLIQSAKMASLGELTAGIAHEIQNPLNFVNNFSELNIELLRELREETINKLAEPDRTAANETMNALAENLSKINEHGRRADSIVKGMLQHSAASTGKKEPTDINALADEYLRLCYFGLRAKNKELTASFTEDFDETIGNIAVVPQDIGRVLLNLYSNAFYAVNEKKKQLDGTFIPQVLVSTKNTGSNVEMHVRDNGTGIPKNILDKIFQPFFTTKPTGQGTGLGLSLSYDIIKAHGGTLKVNTREGEFTEFIIQLPVGSDAISG